ncbi:MAG: FAD:protein FMN transferase [Syntrophomonas sp.]
MKKRMYTIAILLVWFVSFNLAGCGEPQQQAYSRDLFAMDTYITFQVVTGDQQLAEKGLDGVEKAFLEIDRLTNRFDRWSEVSKVNQNAGVAPVKVNKDVFKIMQTAIEWSDKTDGAFNILMGGAMDLWGFGSKNYRIPTEDELAQVLTKTDYHKIILDAEQSTIYLSEKGMVLDLGGVAKGYATDKAIEALKKLGIKNALINAGGNVYAMGTKADGDPWKVGVQDPRNPKGIKAVLAGSDVAVVSSGDYQRYFEVNGIRYHHILDPTTGCPARASVGTTIIMKSATIADILSTAFFVKGPSGGIKLAEGFPQLKAALFITGDGKVYKTKAMYHYLIEH